MNHQFNGVFVQGPVFFCLGHFNEELLEGSHEQSFAVD
jgi:hypothetical protein